LKVFEIVGGGFYKFLDFVSRFSRVNSRFFHEFPG